MQARLAEQSPGLTEIDPATDQHGQALIALHLELPTATANAAARTVYRVDLEVRRSVRFLSDGWALSGQTPRPVRAKRAGLDIIRAQSGSFHIVAQFYGEAEKWVSTHPIGFWVMAVSFLRGSGFVIRRFRARAHATRPPDQIPPASQAVASATLPLSSVSPAPPSGRAPNDATADLGQLDDGASLLALETEESQIQASLLVDTQDELIELEAWF